MAGTDWRRVRELFEAAAELPVAERDAWLAAECGEDGALRARVQALLAEADDEEGEDERTTAFDAALSPELLADLATEQPGAALVGRTIGGFRTVGVLGSGGMGVVLRAQQESPRREVALKVLAGVMVTDSARARFDYEGEILGRLQHPGIAQVYATGSEPDPVTGQPLLWIAMELVRDAQPIDRYAAMHDLDIPARVALLAQVCDAVEHGHRSGVLHRDLKPGNVLVDVDGRPKVIDFGIARATDPGGATHTLTGQVLGTPRYMSPEQLGGEGRRVDTRTDVWSLGVLLFELVTGTAPHDPAGRSFEEFARLVRERAAPRPSRLAGVDTDLDRVCSRALAIDPDARYGSVGELAADLRRHLAGEPVLAGPSTSLYVLRSFLRRHRTAAAFAATALVLLVAGTLVSVLGWSAAARSARLAEAEASTQAAVTDWLAELLGSARVDRSGPDVRVVDLLDGGESRLDQLREQPVEVEAAIRNVMAQSWLSLDQDQRALDLLRAGEERMRRELPEEHSDHAEALYLKGVALGAVGEYEAAALELEAVLALRQRRLGPHAPETAYVHHALAVNLVRQGRGAEAEARFGEVEAVFREHFGADDPRTLAVVVDRVDSAHQRDEYDAVRADLQAALARARSALEPQHPTLLSLVVSNANDARHRGDADAAEVGYREALELCRRVHGTGSAAEREVLGNLAVLSQDRGDHDAAEAAFEELVAAHVALGDDPLQELIARNNLASIQLRGGHPDRSLASYDALLERAAGKIPTDHWLHATFLRGRGAARLALGQHTDAEVDLRESLRVFEATLGADNPRTLTAVRSLAELCEATGQTADAAALRERLGEGR